METSLFDKAVKFATEAHCGTERRGKGYPYIIHPMEAAAIVATMTNDQDDVTIEQIRELFGDRVAELVQHETAPLDDSLTWREKKTAQLKQLAEAPRDSKIVALGDKFSNMSGIALDYRQMGDEVWKRFHTPNGKSDVEWYYRSLADAMSELSETLVYQEYVKLLKEVFG